MTITIGTLLAAHAAGKSLTATIEETYARIEKHNDPALFLTIRPKSEALAIAERMQASGAAGKPLYGVPFVENRGKSLRERARRNGAHGGAGISGVYTRVSNAIEGHGRGARGNHAQDNPAQFGCRRHATGSKHGCAESKWKRKDGVLPLDHLQRNAQIF